MLIPEETCMRCFAQLNKPKGVCPVCGCDNAVVANEAHQLECGSILAGTYLIGKVLGQGGFGITYIGWDLNLDIKVAIKEYYPEGCVTRDTHTHVSVLTYAGAKEAYFQKGKERFVNEARALAKFSGDSGVVGVRTFFYENGTAYIVMDFVEGETLKSYAKRMGGRLPAAEVLARFQPIFRSLARVHDNGLLHRDISPDNIMLKTDGTLALLDFGAARQMSTEGEHSNTINVKHGFAPEEQYRTRGEQGPWTDVYALSATIYRLTTGVTPPEALDRMADGTLLVPPNQLGADFTPAQEAALIHGLAVRATERTRDVRQLEKELYGGERTVLATPPMGASYEYAAPSAPQSAFAPQPQSMGKEPTQNNGGASAENTSGATPQDDAGQKETKRSKGRKICAITAYTVFAVALILIIAAIIRFGAPFRFGILGAVVIGLLWFYFKKGALKSAGKKERIAAVVVLSVSFLMLALFLTGVIINLSIPSVPVTAQATEAPAEAQALTVTQAPAAAQAYTETLDPTIIIDWQDSTIEAGIRKALGKSEGEAITTGEVAYIYDLKIAGDALYINDDFIWPSVYAFDNTYTVDYGQTVLPISDQTISLADMANFGGLTTLSVYAVNVSELESLKNCVSLGSVLLDACGDIDLNAFSGCNSLYAISVSNCDAVTLTNAWNALSIDSLSLSSCGPIDAGELAQFSNLNFLELWNSPVTSAEQIGTIANLSSLSLGSIGVTNFDFLQNLTHLSALSLSGDEITSLPSLDALTELTMLHLTYCELDDSDLQQIASHTGLTDLMLDGCPFSDLSFVENLKNLVVISFDSSKVRDITPLKNLTKLETLWLLNLDVSDISVLSNLKSLAYIWIHETQIKDYSPLEGLPIQQISVDAAYEQTIREMFPNAEVSAW
ncbi:MAG TPA: protein kinase [Feifaniaceae bacterium]|nr:protein kinase [Feifaniaceae bacterium]